ncbi:MAG TPA: metallophosphoesterase, partial [Candidatus Limnocylindrales bacterium]|nr:metallophosphoesterase [Candidatus Limnocylindrales bacterium]
TSGASGYLAYFGARAAPAGTTWYAYDLGTWRIYALDSNCFVVGCDPGGAQYEWLQADLAANPRPCVLAYWHHPRFSSGQHGNDAEVAPFWDALYAAGAEVIVNGHDHDYERFAPLAPSGEADPERGIRQIVAGTGGAALRDFDEEDPNSEVRQASTYGVLRLDLHRGSYDWQFIPVAGGSFTDQGSGTCH